MLFSNHSASQSLHLHSFGSVDAGFYFLLDLFLLLFWLFKCVSISIKLLPLCSLTSLRSVRSHVYLLYPICLSLYHLNIVLVVALHTVQADLCMSWPCILSQLTVEILCLAYSSGCPKQIVRSVAPFQPGVPTRTTRTYSMPCPSPLPESLSLCLCLPSASEELGFGLACLCQSVPWF